MIRHTLKILEQMLQDFKSVSDHFTTLRSKGSNFPNKTFETAELWCIVGLTAILCLFQRENSKLQLSLICSLYCCLVEEGFSPESCLAICHPRASCL